MPFAAALSTHPETKQALAEVCTRAGADLGDVPDLAVVFYSPRHCAAAEDIAAEINEKLRPRALLGCPGEAIAGGDTEVEGGSAISLWLAKWRRDVQVLPFHLTLQRTPEGHSILGRPDELLSADAEHSAVLLLADPFTFPIDVFLKQMNAERPGLRIMGGMASAGRARGQNPLLGGGLAQEGAVGVLLQGQVRLRAVVSQGCRPVGRHMVVTKVRENIILELGGKSPMEQLQQLWEESSPEDQALLQQGLHIGCVINEYQADFQRGDFLVRNVIGIDEASGALAITDRVRVGQTVQFHVRDAATADEDLHELLQIDVSAASERPAGALLFTCNGRGSRLFETPHHDVRVIQREAGPIPLAGFFAAGELGPIGGRNFIHGFTASVVLFED